MRKPAKSAPQQAAAARVRQLAWFRYQLRKFLYFSEKAARSAGVTPQQHQLLLGVAGFTGRGWTTISELAEFLQERHNAVVGLVDRACRRGLVSKETIADDHRFVRVDLTPLGKKILALLAALHRKELARFQARTGLILGPNLKAADDGNAWRKSSLPRAARGVRARRAPRADRVARS